jgi:hypothetical protein
MKGSITALCLALLVSTAGAASAATAVADFSDPTKTSNVTLVANADGKTTEVTEGGTKAVQTGGTADGTVGYLYLNVQDDLFKDSKALWVRVDYFDQGTDTWHVEYDTEDDPHARVASAARRKFDTRVWTSHTVKLLNFQLQGRQAGGSDIAITDEGDGPEIIRQVIISDEDPDTIRFPKVDPAKPITINGVKAEGEWDGALRFVLDRADQDVTNNFESKEDFSGTYSYKWDEKGMYVLGEVTDATPRLNDAPHDGRVGDYWAGDGFELFIGLDQSDPNRTTYQEGTDFHIFVGTGEVPGWANQYFGVSSEDRGPVPAENIAIVNTDTGYMFEFFMPWTFLHADAKVTDGQMIAWYMFANNSRVIGPSNQNMAMTPFKRNGPSGNPSRWATAVLEPARVVENPPAAGN